MIKITKILKRFGDKTVLKNFSLLVNEGETIALLGLSGSGKTTALKSICGLVVPEEGSIEVDGTELSENTLSVVRRKLGYVIQDGGLFPHLTARENITIVGREGRLSESLIEERIEKLTKLAKISPDLLDRYPRELSGGQRQRIGIIRALIHDPPILLMDEPMGALDPITRKELQTELRELFKELKKTVVMVTHDLYEAMYMADRILLLENGTVIQEGPMEELLNKPANEFVSLFIRAQRHHVTEEET